MRIEKRAGQTGSGPRSGRAELGACGRKIWPERNDQRAKDKNVYLLKKIRKYFERINLKIANLRMFYFLLNSAVAEDNKARISFNSRNVYQQTGTAL